MNLIWEFLVFLLGMTGVLATIGLTGAALVFGCLFVHTWGKKKGYWSV